MDNAKDDIQGSGLVRRRNLLKTASGIGIATFGISGATNATVTRPEPSDFNQGEVKFVEIKEEYPDLESHPAAKELQCCFRDPNYVYEGMSDMVILTEGSTGAIRPDTTVAGAGGLIHATETAVPLSGSKMRFPVETDYGHWNSRYVTLDTRLSSHSHGVAEGAVDTAADGMELSRVVTVSDEDKNIRVEGPNVSEQIAAGNEITMRSNDTEIVTASGTVETTRQSLSIVNHGKVSVYGHEEYRMYPLNSSHKYANSQGRFLLKIAQEETTRLSDANLVAIPKDLDTAERVQEVFDK